MEVFTLVWSIIEILGTVFVWGTILLAKSYFGEKGKNLATKEDIAGITKTTESVKAEVQKEFEKFDMDLKFKYQLYEKQYRELYAELFLDICQSEALRWRINYEEGQQMEFKDVPIVTEREVQVAGRLQETELLTCRKIVDSVKKNYFYASPKLTKISCMLNGMIQHAEDQEVSEKEVQLRINLVETILRDYCWLREQLRLQDDGDDIEKIENGTFASELFILHGENDDFEGRV